MRRILAAFAFAALSISGAHAQSPTDAATEAASEFGPAVGSIAPEFAITDATGQVRTLANLSGENGVVIYFNRSLDWCPICLRQALEVDAAQEAFEAAGWGVALLTYDSSQTLARVADQRELTLTLLGDEAIEVIDAFDVRDPIYADPDHMAHGVPYPIAFAIRPDGEIVGKFWHEAGLGQRRGYATRISADDVIAALPN